MRDDARGFLLEMLEMTSGPLIWFAHLVVVYGTASVSCSEQGVRFLDEEAVVVATVVSTLAALAAVATMLVRSIRELRTVREAREVAGRGFVDAVTIALCGFAVIGIVWTALPALLGPDC